MPQFEPEQRIGKYRFLRFLGRGSMGVVYLAEDETLGRDVALKVLDRNVVSDPEFETRFRQEAKTVARLQHPNIVPIHSLESIGGELAIDMAFIEGGPLSEQAASVEQAVKWVGDVLEALVQCHASGIVHRDVKPSNILLSPDGRALLSDFGLAKLLAVQQSTQIRRTSSSCMFVGTPMYAPPEAWEGVDPTPAWDVYSVGMVLYEKVSGRLPYNATTPLALLKQMLAKPIPALSEVSAQISPELNEAVHAMLVQDPGQRPQDASSAIERLQHAPEYVRAHQITGSTLVPRLSKLRSIRRGMTFRYSLAARRVLKKAALPLVVVGVASLVALPWLLLKLAGPNVSPAIPLNMKAAAVLDTVDPSGPSMWPEHWLMEPLAGKAEWKVLASGDTHLWMLTAKRQVDGRFAFEGNWAWYADSTARLFEYGVCVGTGQLDKERGELAVSLQFKDTQDGENWQKSLLVRPSKRRVAPEEVISRIQSADFVPSLMYNEMQPRHVEWLDDLEKTWLSRVAEFTTVPYVDEGKKPVVVDGQMIEPAWQPALTTDRSHMGELESSGPGKATLALRYSKQALYVAVSGRGIPKESVLEVGVLRSFDIHTADSPRWMARIGKEGVVSALYMNKQSQTAWECNWQGAVGGNEEVWSAEVRIPFDNLAPVVVPQEGQRWRLVCNVRQEMDGSEGEPLAYWGAPAVLNAERGAVIVYGSLELGQ